MVQEVNKDHKYIVFQLADEEYALSVNQVGSIERMMKITRVPHAADFVRGVINLRGIVMPVIDLRSRFTLQEGEYGETTRIIISYMNDIEVGLIVDAANDVVDIPNEMIETSPSVVGSVDVNYISGVAKIDDRLLIILDLEKVLSQEEVDDIKSVEGSSYGTE